MRRAESVKFAACLGFVSQSQHSPMSSLVSTLFPLSPDGLHVIPSCADAAACRHPAAVRGLPPCAGSAGIRGRDRSTNCPPHACAGHGMAATTGGVCGCSRDPARARRGLTRAAAVRRKCSSCLVTRRGRRCKAPRCPSSAGSRNRRQSRAKGLLSRRRTPRRQSRRQRGRPAGGCALGGALQANPLTRRPQPQEAGCRTADECGAGADQVP